MLTERERRHVLSSIRYSYYLLHPVAVDVDSGEFGSCLSRRKKLFCNLSFAFFLVHTILKNLRLIYAFMCEKDETELFHFIIHVTLASTMVVVAFSYYSLFIRNPAVHAAVVKLSTGSDSFQGNQHQFVA